MEITRIQRAIRKEYYFTHHAVEKMLERGIDQNQIVEAIENGEIIEEYSEDKYGPTCLILGFTKTEKPLHVLVSYSEPLWVITAYEPEEREWGDFKARRTK